MIEQVEQFLFIWSVANFVSLAFTFLCFKYPKTGRQVFGIIFLLAGLINATLAILKPSFYLEYGKFSFLSVYEEFIYGYFARSITLFVLIIAVCQLGIAGGMLGRGRFLVPAILGAMAFLLAIVPLGVGSGFPATLFLIIGLWPILQKESRWKTGAIREK
ncbi:MAG: hypothetical protein ACE5FF_15115 [Saprospiraceae bacterium]